MKTEIHRKDLFTISILAAPAMIIMVSSFLLNFFCLIINKINETATINITRLNISVPILATPFLYLDRLLRFYFCIYLNLITGEFLCSSCGFTVTIPFQLGIPFDSYQFIFFTTIRLIIYEI